MSTCYFKKHIAAFITNYGHTTPLQLYNSVDISLPVSQRHEMWLQKVRQAVCNRIVNEEDRVPTYTSLWRHWLRSRANMYLQHYIMAIIYLVFTAFYDGIYYRVFYN